MIRFAKVRIGQNEHPRGPLNCDKQLSIDGITLKGSVVCWFKIHDNLHKPSTWVENLYDRIYGANMKSYNGCIHGMY